MSAQMRPNLNSVPANGARNGAGAKLSNGAGKQVSLAEMEALPPAQVPHEEVDLWAEESPFEEVRRSHRNWTKYWIAAAILATVIAASVTAWKAFSGAAAPAYDVTTVQRRDIAKTISATGKVQAVTTVQVGTQVSGTISNLYVDFNDHVTKDQVIARIDPAQLEAQLMQARANLSSAEARVQTAQSNVVSADASVGSAQANVDRADSAAKEAQRNFEQVKSLIDAGAAPKNDLPPAQAQANQALAAKQQADAQLNQAKAQAQSARSQLSQSQAERQQSQAAVEIAAVNLSRSVIKAPIDGVVISRDVNVGQTVASSLQAPTIFQIANDLTQMQVLADIDEADVGQLNKDSGVTFTVDAYPNDTFQGQISQLRLSPQTLQNVTTYTAVIAVKNPDLKLRPGMTANVTATVGESKNALVVPNSALRFRPANADDLLKAAADARDASRQNGADAATGGNATAAPSASVGANAPGNPSANAAAEDPGKGQRAGRHNGAGNAAGGNRAEAANRAVVWKVNAGQLEPVRLQLGLTDGVSTEVTRGNLQPGDHIAIPAAAAQKVSQQPARSPMNPMGGGRRR